METKIQDQINQLNNKVDIILNYISHQQLRTESVDDFISDLSIIGHDAYKSVVTELEDQQVMLDPDDIKTLGIKMIKNIKHFIAFMDMIESFMDLIKDVSPVANELIIDFTKKLDEFQQKGYFNLLKRLLTVVDSTVTEINREGIPEYSLWKLLKHMRKREMRTSFGLIATSMKNLSQLNK